MNQKQIVDRYQIVDKPVVSACLTFYFNHTYTFDLEMYTASANLEGDLASITEQLVSLFSGKAFMPRAMYKARNMVISGLARVGSEDALFLSNAIKETI